MIKIFILLATVSFLLSSMAFFWALILRYNAKKMLIKQQGKLPEEVFDFEDIKKLDPGLVRTYSIATKLWGVSVLLFVIFAVTVYILR